MRRYTVPQLLCVDEVGYLSYDSRYAARASMLHGLVPRGSTAAVPNAEGSRPTQMRYHEHE
jgi:hypothetical protein